MSKCKNCGIKIADETMKCPLCQQVLTDLTEGNNKYPDLRNTNKKFRVAINIVLFVSILAETVLLIIDYEIGKHLWWSLIIGLALLYLNIFLRVTIGGHSGYQFKTIFNAIIAIMILYGIDLLTGNHGWALNYVYPVLVIGIDITILVLMIVNRRNWQSYLMTQILMICISSLPIVLYGCHILYDLRVVMIGFLTSVFLFLGTVIIGDSRARNELKRRFHL